MLKIADCWLERTSFVDKELVQDKLDKIIFIGRSNVGKSSLINKLLWRKRLARTSSTPGKTISINYYRVDAVDKITAPPPSNGRDEAEIEGKIEEDVDKKGTRRLMRNFYVVDLPGYGYAKISRQESTRVKRLISSFFRTVENAKLVVLLVDCRRGFMAPDLEIITQILDKKINILTVLTKSDKLPYSELANQIRKFQKECDLKVIAFTIKSNNSREELLAYINKALME